MNQNAKPPDPVEFLRLLWGPFGLPVAGGGAPVFKADEIEKRIADLRLVENWLNMNLQVLRASIQGLEMQQATLSAMQGAFQAAGQHAGISPGVAPDTQASNPFVQGPLADAWWNMLQAQIGKPGNPPASPEPEKK